MVSSPRGESRRHVLIGRKGGERIGGVGDGRRLRSPSPPPVPLPP